MKLKSIKPLAGKYKRYDLEVRKNSNFFANRILVHNSSLIVSKYKGQLITRTRGTVDATKLDTGGEIELLKQKYPYAFTNRPEDKQFCREFFGIESGEPDTWSLSFIFEWVSPNNVIVLNYGSEPDLYLTGCINHSDYTYHSQAGLDGYAKHIGVKRPKTYEFESVKKMITEVEKWVGVEGVCCYCNGGWDIRKIKGEDYKAKHRLKSELSSFNKVVDLFFVLGCPTRANFINEIKKIADYEVMIKLQGDVERIYNLNDELYTFIIRAADFSEDNVKLSQKEYAIKAMERFKDFAALAFTYRKAGKIDIDLKRKMFDKLVEKYDGKN